MFSQTEVELYKSVKKNRSGKKKSYTTYGHSYIVGSRFGWVVMELMSKQEAVLLLDYGSPTFV